MCVQKFLHGTIILRAQKHLLRERYLVSGAVLFPPGPGRTEPRATIGRAAVYCQHNSGRLSGRETALLPLGKFRGEK